MGLHLFDKKKYDQARFWIYSAIDSYEKSEYNRVVDFGEEKSHSLYAETLLKQSNFLTIVFEEKIKKQDKFVA